MEKNVPCGACPNRVATLTTVFTPPTSCSNYLTPIGLTPDVNGGGYTVNVTVSECAPPLTGMGLECDVCLFPNLYSATACPYNWTAASTGASGNVTTKYCCPS